MEGVRCVGGEGWMWVVGACLCFYSVQVFVHVHCVCVLCVCTCTCVCVCVCYTSVTADGAEWVGLGGAVVPALRRLPLLLELPRGGGTEQGWPCM